VTQTEPPFSRIGVVGLGLMGGSVALAARVAWPQVELAGFDHDDAVAAAARQRLALSTVAHLSDLADCDLVVLAVPAAASIDMMPTIAALGVRPIVTDLASTKRQVMAAAAAAGLTRFVGGHPMSGSEQSGLDHARADLFAGRPWLLVAGASAPDDAARVERLVAGLGAIVRWIDAEAHDRTVAYVSHLPQLLAVALMNATQAAVGPHGLSAAGRAFSEMTRLAASPPAMWQGILSGNADFVAEALDGLIGSLPAREQIADGRWIAEAFGRAGASRARADDRDHWK
jgi:prephenate dehydrogenase